MTEQLAAEIPFLEKIFFTELSRQSAYALTSIAHLNAALIKRDVSEVFRAVEVFLNHAAKISLILWPANKAMSDRGKSLRKKLGVDDSNPIKTRSARNHLQHFDERLSDWADQTGGNFYIDGNVGPKQGPIVVAGKFPEVLRNFDPGTWVFTFRSEDYDLRSLQAAIEKLAPVAQRLSA